ncbi:hypothetical protein ACWEOA_06070 [Streptomyces sp. NPDC004457]
MPHRDPPGIIAPHIPADLYRAADTTGAPVVIVVHSHPAPSRPMRHYLMPIAVAGAGVIGVFGLVAAFLALLDFAVHTAVTVAGAAGPVGIGGVTLKLTRGKG